jgi:hypothetical protein
VIVIGRAPCDRGAKATALVRARTLSAVTTGADPGDDAPTRQALAKRGRRYALEQAALALFAEQAIAP